jgi:hypothetical protein
MSIEKLLSELKNSLETVNAQLIVFSNDEAFPRILIKSNQTFKEFILQLNILDMHIGDENYKQALCLFNDINGSTLCFPTYINKWIPQTELHKCILTEDYILFHQIDAQFNEYLNLIIEFYLFTDYIRSIS